MRQPCCFSLHRIAAVFSPSSHTTTMYSAVPPPFTGSRGGGCGGGRRSFSDRPSTTVVGGDSSNLPDNYRNFESLFNSGGRGGGRGGGRRSFSDRPFTAAVGGDSLNLPDNFRNFESSFNNGGRGGGFRGGGYRGGGNQMAGGRVSRPKPAHFRSWEFAKYPLPPHGEQFVILSYNILADYLANSHRKLYFHIPRRFMSWEWRKANILFELRLWSPDIMCFQEVDRFHDLEEDLRAHGYSGIWKIRTGDPIDGCAIFWRTTRFKLRYEESVEFNKHGMRDNVAQICVLESLTPNQNKNQLASSASSEGPNRVVICNIHVLYNPRRGEIKLGQVRILLERAQAVSKTWDEAPIVLCGDFNCTPKSPLYNFISEQKLDISEVDRDKVSGQASAVIEPPPRQYGPQLREQPTGDLTSPTNVQNIIIEKENDKECTSENLPTGSLQEPLLVSSLNVMINSSENNRGASDSTHNLKDNQGHLTHLNKDETGLPNSTLRESVEVTMLGATSEPNLTVRYEASDPGTNSALEDVEDLGEDDKEHLSDINSGDASTPQQGDLVLYDPSMWTPMEIKTATGDAESTILEHPLKLKSTYAEVVDSSGTRDSNGEPLVTSFNTCFMGTVDYIWRSEGLCTRKVLAPFIKDVMQPSGGFPTKKWGSDHIALASELAFTKKCDK